jgi:hypothetical protein
MRTLNCLTVTFTIIIATSCSTENVEPLASRRVEPPPAAHNALSVRQEEQAFADFELSEPGSAGFYLAPSGELVLMLSDPTTVSRASVVARRLVNRGPHGRSMLARRIVARHARFSFSQLAHWRDAILKNRFSAQITFLDLDERENRVVIGLKSDRARTGDAQLRSQVLLLGIDTAAILIRDSDGLAPNSGPTLPLPFGSNITAQQDTIVAGLKCWVAGQCTIGIVADRDGVRGFVTTSHSTDKQWELDGGGSPMDQPFDRAIADNETYDPGPYTCGFNECRISDAVWFASRSDIPSQRGLIARANPGLLTWNQTTPYYVITDVEHSDIVVGSVLSMVGSRSGLQGGTVEHSCVDFYFSESFLEDRIMTCAYTASYASDDGDSGAPVFRAGAAGNEVQLLGIHVGRHLGYEEAAFSTYSRVNENLGSNLVVTRPNSLASPVVTGGLQSSPPYSLPKLTWSSVSGATGYKVYRRLCDLDDICDTEFQFIPDDPVVSPYTGDTYVTQYLGTSVPGPHIRKWVGYRLVATSAFDLSGPSNAVYFKQP